MPVSLFQGATPEQSSAATHTGTVLVLAGAGTGKTRTLTLGVAHRIMGRGMLPSRALAVTFTSRAVAEMAGRIRTALGDAGVPRWMGTFHGLAARQLRAEPEVAGLRPGFDILDADDSRRLVKRVMQAINLHAGEAHMSAEVVEQVLSRAIDDLEPTLTRNGYDLPALNVLLHAKPAEVRDFLAGTLAGDRTREFTEQLRIAGLPV